MNNKKCPVCGGDVDLLVVYANGTKVYWCDHCKKSHEEKADATH